MTEPDKGLGQEPEPVQIPEALVPEILRAVDKLMVLRRANRVAYAVTNEGQFGQRVNEDIVDQRTYLISQIRHADARLRVFQAGGIEPLPDLETLSRDELLARFDAGTQGLETVFRAPSSWGRRVDIPYSPPGLTGLAVLNDIALHEAHHEGQNRATLGHFGILQPPEVTATFGK